MASITIRNLDDGTHARLRVRAAGNGRSASRGMAVATRNVRDFEGMGIEILDPWAGA